MNSFADSPLFFFMDNISPIIPKISKDVRKIIELSDRGCDARLPVSKVLRNTTYSQIFPRTQQNKIRKSYPDEKAEKKFYAERYRVQNDGNLMDSAEYYFVPKKDEINQEDCWQKYFPYDDSMEEEEFRRKSRARDFRTKLRATSEKARSNFSRPDDNAYEILSNSVRNNPDITRQNIANEINSLRKEGVPESYLMGARTGGYRSKLSRSTHPKLDPKFTEQAAINREKMAFANQDYSRDCEFRETQRNSSRSHKHHWQKFNAPTWDETENLMDEISPKFHKFSKCNSKNQRPVSGSARSTDVSRDWEETAATRIRSRTCSPPMDRRRNSRSFSKTFYENMDQSNNRYNTVILQDTECSSSNIDPRFPKQKNGDSNHSMKMLKRFVDRAVDRDSLSDVQNVYTSTEQLPRPTILTDASTNQTGMTSYWEFIPLDDDEKSKVSGKRKTSYCHHQISTSIDPLTKRLSKHLNDTSRTKKKSVDKDTKNPESFSSLAEDANFESHDISSFANPQNVSETIDSTLNSFLRSFREQPSKPLSNFDEAKLTPDLEATRIDTSNGHKGSRIIGATKNQAQSKYESKSQSRIDNTFGIGLANRANQYSKRPYSAKSEPNDDKKKKIADVNDGLNLVDHRKVKTNIVERTAACLKRKLDKSKPRDVSANSNQRSPAAMEKKIRSGDPACSRLPIRIGNRVRSRNPFASYRTGVKPYDRKEENKEIIGMKELSESRRLSSVRSRTKPKTRPSVILDETMDYTETSKNSQPLQIVQPIAEDEDSLRENLKGKSPLIDVTVDDNSTELVAVKESSSMSKFLENEKSGMNDDGMDELGVRSTKNDRRKRNTVNRSSTRETNRKTGLIKDMDYGISKNVTEKCCFNLKNGESSNCQDKQHKHTSSFRSRKSTIKSQL